MPGYIHEFPLDLIRHSPNLAAELLELASGSAPPEHTGVRCEASEGTTTSVPEQVTDSVIVLEKDGPDGKPINVLGIIVEPQNREKKEDKPFSWPAYVANVRHRLRCPVILLVLAPTKSVARAVAKPIDLGGGYMVLCPLVLCREEMEPIRDPEIARKHPELTILIVADHCAQDPSVVRTLPPALEALTDNPGTTLYADYVFAALPEIARKYLEDFMGTTKYHEWRSEFARHYAAEGKAQALLMLLESRSVVVSAETRARVEGCTDIELLDVWLRRAGHAHTEADVFH